MTTTADAAEGATGALGRSGEPGVGVGDMGSHGDLYSQDWFAIIRARNTMREAMRAHEHLAPLQLTLRTYVVLSAASEGLRMSQREVADYVMLDERQVVHLIADLERLGFVSREPDEHDRRVRVVSVTPSGAAAYAQAREIMLARQDRALASLTHAERLMLVELLDKISS